MRLLASSFEGPGTLLAASPTFFFPHTMFAEQTLEVEHAISIMTAVQPEEAQGAGKPHTLQKFAEDHFRPPPKRTLSHVFSRKQGTRNEMWAFGKVSYHMTFSLVMLCNHDVMHTMI